MSYTHEYCIHAPHGWDGMAGEPPTLEFTITLLEDDAPSVAICGYSYYYGADTECTCTPHPIECP